MISAKKQSMGAVGFFLCGSLDEKNIGKGNEACNQALAHFPWLKKRTITHGEAHLFLWSHHELNHSLHQDHFGNLFILVGSPMNSVFWEDVSESAHRVGFEKFTLPWEGRCVLICVSSNGKNWTIWNDWTGAIPVFHTLSSRLPLASSLESAVVACCDFTSQDFSRRGLVEMLVHGQFLGTDTLFSKMSVLAADTVSVWKDTRFYSKYLRTVEPSDSRWNQKRSDSIEEMHDLTISAITEAFKHHKKLTIPLSGGMDSRLFACVATDMGMEFKAYTYGPKKWLETVYASKVAKILKADWQRIDLGVNYLEDYTPMWLDWFGSSLHAHGMYQMPFLARIIDEEGVIPDGWYGNNLAGGNHPSHTLLNYQGALWEGFYNGYGVMWNKKDLEELLTFDLAPIFDEMKLVINNQVAQVKHWPLYHQRNAVDMWNRQQRFVYYQPQMYDYWKGSCTPFMNRTYAKFCFSLRPDLLIERHLQQEMLKRYWPEVAAIGGTYFRSNVIEGRFFAAKKIIKKFLPWSEIAQVLKKFNVVLNTMEIDCVKASGIKAVHPLKSYLDRNLTFVDGIFNPEPIRRTLDRALTCNEPDYAKITALQPIVWRMLNSNLSRK